MALFTPLFPVDDWNCMCRIRTINGYKLQKRAFSTFYVLFNCEMRNRPKFEPSQPTEEINY
jgi:hypothetical protein